MFSNFESSFALLSVRLVLVPKQIVTIKPEKGRRACNYISGIWITCIKKVDAKCWLEEMTLDISDDIITLGACLHVFFNVCLQSHLFLLCADWQKFDSSVNREPQGNEAEFKIQRCNLSFLFLPRCQSIPESLPAGYMDYWIHFVIETKYLV